MKKIAIITIGQTPRIDLTPDIATIFDAQAELVEYGALDLLSAAQIEADFHVCVGDEILVSRMRDGKEVMFTQRYVIPKIQACITQAEADGCDASILCCTGVFPVFIHRCLLIEPQKIIHSLALNLSQGQQIGVCVPHENQVNQAVELWKKRGLSIQAIPVSPYGEQEVIGERVRKAFAETNLAFICLDCIGYSTEMKREVERQTGKPVLLPRTMVANIVKDLLCST
jgi:protein AroM